MSLFLGEEVMGVIIGELDHILNIQVKSSWINVLTYGLFFLNLNIGHQTSRRNWCMWETLNLGNLDFVKVVLLPSVTEAQDCLQSCRNPPDGKQNSIYSMEMKTDKKQVIIELEKVF